ncbi:hypothetical protein DP42_5269 [Burkholderia pseudomallei]|nr:hypothetical protein DP42_5269 [Burkholderia pseudomallei]
MPARRAERARGFLERRIELRRRGDHRDDHARNREVQIADEQARNRIREHPAIAGELLRQHADQALAAGEHDHHEADDDARERERKREERDQRALARECAAREQEARDRRQRERRERDGRGQRDRRCEAFHVARVRQQREIGVDEPAARGHPHERDHRQQPERDEHGERGREKRDAPARREREIGHRESGSCG